MIGIVRLHWLFQLDADRGDLIWMNPPDNHCDLVGTSAGSPCRNKSGKTYRHIQIDGRKYKRSHIVFAMTQGRWPEPEIDHIDGDSLNDRPSNLREATHTQNAWNHKRRKKPSPCPMGVRQIPSGRFVARIAATLGTFDSEDEARSAYLAARRMLFGEFA